MLKRTVDCLIAGLLLLVLSPVVAAIAGLVLLRLGRPVLFRQVRPGLGGRPFTMYKLRTMREAVDEAGESLSDEQRLTRFGRWLRSSSLDELPELWNVLRGDMSLVGPRPLLMKYLPLYDARQARRHEVRPGITGWAQVNGRNALAWEERLELDVWYVDNRSFWLDMRIALLTLERIFSRRGISAPGHATMPEFGAERPAGSVPRTIQTGEPT